MTLLHIMGSPRHTKYKVKSPAEKVRLLRIEAAHASYEADVLYRLCEGRNVAAQISRLRRKAAAADTLADKVMREDMSPALSPAKAL
jgi:hypothetical protein